MKSKNESSFYFISMNCPSLLLLILLVSASCTSNLVAQSNTLPAPRDGWHRIQIKDIGSIDVPKRWIVESETKLKKGDILRRQMGVPNLDFYVHLEPKESESVLHRLPKAGISIYTERGKVGQYYSSSDTEVQISTDGLKIMDNMTYNRVNNYISNVGAEIIGWDKLSQGTLNGMLCFTVNYFWGGADFSDTIESLMTLPNNDRVHYITARIELDHPKGLNQENDWISKDIYDMLRSFRLIKN